MQITAQINSSFNRVSTLIHHGLETKSVLLPPKTEGIGSAMNGAELLLLSLATCYCHTIYRGAQHMNIGIKEIAVSVNGDFSGPVPEMEALTFSVQVRSSATDQQLQELIGYADLHATIPNLLRKGSQISLRA